mmetsp:Transcript_46973/g.123717  ORF Transcript_46973/g.123717 Transcript_46973/m.123717 type:complete len:232 (+) Transcript_46973:3-698(+)
MWQLDARVRDRPSSVSRPSPPPPALPARPRDTSGSTTRRGSMRRASGNRGRLAMASSPKVVSCNHPRSSRASSALVASVIVVGLLHHRHEHIHRTPSEHDLRQCHRGRAGGQQQGEPPPQRQHDAHVLRVAQPDVERKAVAPRHFDPELEAVVDASVTDRGVHGDVERLASGDVRGGERPYRCGRCAQRSHRSRSAGRTEEQRDAADLPDLSEQLELGEDFPRRGAEQAQR